MREHAARALGAAGGRGARPQLPRAPPPQLVEPDEGLGVVGGGDRAVEIVEGPCDELDALVLLDLGAADVVQAGGEEDVDALVGEAGGAPVGLEVLPVVGGLSDLLGELALAGVERLLALLVELAGGQLEQVGDADRLARLADQVQVLVVVGDDGDRAHVADDLALGLAAVVVAEAVAADGDDLALVDRVAGQAGEVGAHAAASCSPAASRSASTTSSMPSRAATDTRSSGWWLRSVPFARFT